MINRIIVGGRLTQDPEIRHTQQGTAVANFTLACGRDFDRTKTDFINIVAWRQTAEFVTRYFSKGRMAIVSGRLQNREWTDKNGASTTTAEVVAESVYFADSKKEEPKMASFEDIGEEDDLPFEN